jgi:hypothetical protein
VLHESAVRADAGRATLAGPAVAEAAGDDPRGRVLERRATGRALRPDLFRDGAVVSFDSDAANIVPGDTNAAADVFVRVVGP